MKISIYSSGDNPPFWNIVFGHMTLKELEGVISFSSMMMNAAREAKLKIKDDDVNQLKIDFETLVTDVTLLKEEKAKEKKELILQNQLANPYHGSDAEMKAFLEELDDNFEKQWIYVDDDRVLALLEKHNKVLSTMNNKLKVLAGRYHCELKFRGRILKQFYLNFKK